LSCVHQVVPVLVFVCSTDQTCLCFLYFVCVFVHKKPAWTCICLQTPYLTLRLLIT
ncbi:hypothetical protein PGIGA_G00253660, partial [Pangasianodon gigas]|nr:hypothetical protein [Pangasianodon gigas]